MVYVQVWVALAEWVCDCACMPYLFLRLTVDPATPTCKTQHTYTLAAHDTHMRIHIIIPIFHANNSHMNKEKNVKPESCFVVSRVTRHIFQGIAHNLHYYGWCRCIVVGLNRYTLAGTHTHASLYCSFKRSNVLNLSSNCINSLSMEDLSRWYLNADTSRKWYSWMEWNNRHHIIFYNHQLGTIPFLGEVGLILTSMSSVWPGNANRSIVWWSRRAPISNK